MFTTPQAIREYALAGHATLTLTSEVSGKHYTFRISQAKDRATGEPVPRWFVALLTGPDNTSDYQYVGMLDANAFRTTKGSKLAADSAPVRGFNFFWRHVVADLTPPQMQVEHSGHCGRCGRMLTHPESLANGIGPECAKKMGE